MNVTDQAHAAIAAHGTLSPAMLQAMSKALTPIVDGEPVRALYRGDAKSVTLTALANRGLISATSVSVAGSEWNVHPLTPLGRMVHAITKTSVGELITWAAQRDADAAEVQPTPTDPASLVVGQHIRANGTHYRVVRKASASGVNARHGEAVAVTIAGGYGSEPVWYGDHRDAIASIPSLLSRHGIPEVERRGWPQSKAAVRYALEMVLKDCVVPGWVSHAATANGDVIACVNLPSLSSPEVVERARDLVTRYFPYRNARVRPSGSPACPSLLVDQNPKSAR